jgi:hypothetical protein
LDEKKLKETSETQLGMMSPEVNKCLLPLEQQSASALHSKNETVSVVVQGSLPKVNSGSGESHTSSKKSSSFIDEQQRRDDIVSLDLMKTLLFQNYYTFDATAIRRVSNQSKDSDHFMMIKRTEEDVQASSNDDGWATVEHGFMQHSNIPREQNVLTRASPFQPFCNLGDPLADLVMVLVIPEGNITDYFRGVVSGATVFAGKVALEALSTATKLTRFAANQLNSKTLPLAPRRPRNAPRHAGDAAGHAYESVVRGLREANYKIVTMLLREYQNSGAGGAARSAFKGIPVGAGASEALSYTLLGLRNQLRPDLR